MSVLASIARKGHYCDGEVERIYSHIKSGLNNVLKAKRVFSWLIGILGGLRFSACDLRDSSARLNFASNS